jgi:acetylglutamate kinase
VIQEITSEKYQKLLEEKIISDGILPKLHNSFQALESGVKNIFLGDFRLLKKESVYTKITD